MYKGSILRGCIARRHPLTSGKRSDGLSVQRRAKALRPRIRAETLVEAGWEMDIARVNQLKESMAVKGSTVWRCSASWPLP